MTGSTRFVRVATLMAAVGLLAAGCGSTASTVTTHHPQPTNEANASSFESTAYCQYVGGHWVTNNVSGNVTACVPNPGDATGDVSADESSVEPRCRTCTMAQWNAAEKRAAGGGTGSSPTHSTPIVPSVTGYGATNAAWNSAHQPVGGFTPGSVYDADPSLPDINGHEGARYVAVLHGDGHVLDYTENLQSEPISQARSSVIASEFPSDAKVVWFRAVGTDCAQMLVQSATSSKALGTNQVGDNTGTVLVEFSSGVADDSYDPENVNQALFQLAPLTGVSGAPGC